jgi:hypothetical protein
MNRTALLSATALLFGTSAAFAAAQEANHTPFATMATKISAPKHDVTPHNFVAYDAGNFDTKYADGEFTPWYGYVLCGAGVSNSHCNNLSFAFSFTTGATAALAKAGGYQVGLMAPASICSASSATVALYTNSGSVPGTVVPGTSNDLTVTTAFGTYGAPINKTFKKAVQLLTSTEYWLVVSPDAGKCIAWGSEDTDYVDSYSAAVLSGATWFSTSFTSIVPAFGVVR